MIKLWAVWKEYKLTPVIAITSLLYNLSGIQNTDHEQSLAKYMKQTMKKDDKSRMEVNDELYANRKKFHQVRKWSYNLFIFCFYFDLKVKYQLDPVLINP